MALLESTNLVNDLLDIWQRENRNPTELVSILTRYCSLISWKNYNVLYLNRIAEVVEKETEAYLKMDPDPFDDRHPIRARPDCSLGLVLKVLFRNEDFMNKVFTIFTTFAIFVCFKNEFILIFLAGK